MPIIGQTKILDAGPVSRGVLVDPLGYFVARVQWTGKRPMINKTGTPRAERRILLTLDKNPNAANVPNDSARWDFEALDWIVPVDTFYLIKEETGVLVKRFKGWRERLPDCPEGCLIVDDVPPVTRSSVPIYNAVEAQWVLPRRVALVDAEGVVQNVVLENPNDTTPDVPVPEGWERFDDRTPWPTDDEGALVGIGAKKAAGKWTRPDRPVTPAPRNG